VRSELVGVVGDDRRLAHCGVRRQPNRKDRGGLSVLVTGGETNEAPAAVSPFVYRTLIGEVRAKLCPPSLPNSRSMISSGGTSAVAHSGSWPPLTPALARIHHTDDASSLQYTLARHTVPTAADATAKLRFAARRPSSSCLSLWYLRPRAPGGRRERQCSGRLVSRPPSRNNHTRFRAHGGVQASHRQRHRVRCRGRPSAATPMPG